MTREFNPHTISLIVGLGNPGKEYENTFHNAGRLIIETILKTQSLSSPKHSFSYTKIGQFTFMIPNIYMNESGLAVNDALTYFKFLHSSLLIIHDDADLQIGTAKLQFGRGDAGHNGIKSIVKALDTEEFWRFRIGIRREESEGEKRRKAESFVLSQIKKSEKKIFQLEAETIKKMLVI
ncbi:MAG: aminoacyl-tRNA hydrolase [Candidatus Paceibacterota bacterium]|jgi:PTH1 family peptidyl-tRNA hydrolase